MILLCAGFGIFYIVFTLGDLSAGFTSDDAVYLLLADLYTFGTHNELPVYQIVREQALFPPLFPMLLGLTGGGSGDFAQSSLITVVCLILALSLAVFFILQQVRPSAAALLPAAVLFLLPGTLVMGQDIWSEFLFMLWLYLIFIVAGHEGEINHRWIILAVLVALATLTRTAGVTLIPPFLLLLFLGHRRSYWLPAIISTAPFVAWYVPREWLRDSPGYTSTLTSSLQDAGTSILQSLPAKISAMFESLRWLFAAVDGHPTATSLGGVLLLVVLLIAGSAFYQRIKAFRFDALFCLCYLAMVMVWPFADVYYLSRLIYPVIPLFLLYTTLGILRNCQVKKHQYVVAGMSMFLFVLISGPSLHQFVARGFAKVSPELKPYRNDRTWLLAPEPQSALLQNIRFIVETLRNEVQGAVSEQDCIYAFQPPFVMLHTKRVSGLLPPPGVPDEQFKRDTTACRYIVALPITDLAGLIPEYYPLQRTRNGYVQTSFYQQPETRSGSAVFLLRKIADTIRPE